MPDKSRPSAGASRAKARTEAAAPADEGTPADVISADTKPRRSDGPKMKGVFLLLEACDGDCHTQEIATGKAVGELRTKAQEWGRGVGYYRVNASWVDDKGVAHTGVVYPES